jgi:hypothetical protein
MTEKTNDEGLDFTDLLELENKNKITGTVLHIPSDKVEYHRYPDESSKKHQKKLVEKREEKKKRE